MKKMFAIVFTITIVILLTHAGKCDPTSYLDEKVNAQYFMNGTLENLVKRGYLSVSVGNDEDVLQYIQITLTSTDGTNLLSPTAYRSTASSPYGDDKTNLFFNTTDSMESSYYEITKNVSLIRMSLQYQNKDGGKDLHHGKNILTFRITLTSNVTFSNVTLTLQVRKDVYQGNDAMNIINPVATSYKSLGRKDTDNDGVYDKLTWFGDIDKEVQIVFDGEITPNLNFDENLRMDELAGECKASYVQDSTFTGIRVKDRASKGPVRQGIDLNKLMEGGWTVRGFIKNMAKDLKYRVNGWAIYEIGNETPIASSTKSFELDPGKISYTKQFPVGEKNYFSSSYDWEVIWGDSFYSGEIESYVDPPTLYQIDSVATKTIMLEKNDNAGRTLRIRDQVKHLGSYNLPIHRVILYSKTPSKSESGDSIHWSISDIRVYEGIGPKMFDVTSQANITNFGDFVEANVNLLTPLNPNDILILEFYASSSSESKDENYTFSFNSTLITDSGTPEKRFVEKSIFIPGVTVKPPGGGGPPGVTRNYTADLFKEESSSYVVGNIGYINVTYGVIDTGDKGIRDNKLMILAPKEGKVMDVKIQIYKNGRWINSTLDRNYTLTDAGTVKVGEKVYHQYLIDFKKKLNLYNKEKLRITYVSSLPQGKNEIITKMSGYNYYRDAIISEEVHSFLMVKVHVTKLTITESEWNQERSIVGSPVIWTKDFQIENTNDFTVEDYVATEVFKDAISVHVVEDGNEERLSILDSKVRFKVKLDPGEKKFIRIKMFTPPVIEIRKDVSPISKDGEYIILKINSTIKNFAKEAYKNVTYILRQPKKNIVGYSGIDLFSRGNETWGEFDLMFPSEERTFTITYRQEPPILIVRLDNYNFSQKDKANVHITVIPRGENWGYIEIETTGPIPRLETQYADILDVGNKPKEFEETIDLKGFQPGEYELDTKFKEDLVTILSDQKKFYVSGKKIIEISSNLLLLILLLFILFMFKRMYKKKERFEEELDRIRRKLREI
ncbi:MAG: hypothetical protein J7L45_03565 [Candidatus Aenigmarchaeota archaeon]|nr:hypothetical protein [Candidatus Aenigmarchaeota archaeon]